MTLRSVQLRAVLAAALLAGGPAALIAPAAWAQQALAAPATEHEENVKQILLDSHTVAMGRLALLTSKPGYQRELFQHFFASRSDEALAASYAREVAGKVTKADALAARRLSSLPESRALFREIERVLVSGSALEQSAEVKRLDQQMQRRAKPGELAALMRFYSLAKGLSPHVLSAIETHGQELTRRFQLIMVEMARLGMRDDFKAAEIPTARVGFGPFDRMLDVYSASLQATAALSERTQSANASVALDTLLEARHMVHRPGIERGRAMLARTEQITADHLTALQDIHARRVEQLMAVMRDLPGFDAAAMHEKASPVMEFLLKTGENRQRQYAVLRRMLAFAEARLGQTTVKDDQLMFASDADVQTWVAMAEEIRQLDGQDTKDVETQQERSRRIIGGMENKR